MNAASLQNILCVLFATMIGGSVGSFLNVVVWRLPNGMSLIHPGSFCPNCRHPIRWFDNIPIFGWLMLRGECRDCKTPISFRYPLVEAVCAGIAGFFAVSIFFGEWTGPTGSALAWESLPQLAEGFWQYERGERLWPPLTLLTSPEGFLAARMAMVFVWSGIFYLLLTIGLIEFDGRPVPRLLPLLLWCVIAALWGKLLFDLLTSPQNLMVRDSCIVSAIIVPSFFLMYGVLKGKNRWLYRKSDFSLRLNLSAIAWMAFLTGPLLGFQSLIVLLTLSFAVSFNSAVAKFRPTATTDSLVYVAWGMVILVTRAVVASSLFFFGR